MIELGGTIGDMESLPFVEALRQLRHKVGNDNFNSVFVRLAAAPIPSASARHSAPLPATAPPNLEQRRASVYDRALRVNHTNSLIPEIVGHEGEMVQKTKPTQHGVKELRYVGLTPDIIVCRSDSPMEDSSRESLAMYSQVSAEQVGSLSLSLSLSKHLLIRDIATWF